MNTDRLTTLLGAISGLLQLAGPVLTVFYGPAAGIAAGAAGAAIQAGWGYFTNKH